jgi:hypothetical protein
MQILILLLVLIGLSSVHAQSDLELVRSFGKALESTPSIVNKNASRKSIALDKIWTPPKTGAKARLAKYLNGGNKDKFDNMIIYNAQKYVSHFLIDAIETNNIQRIKEIAELYLLPLKYLTESNTITFAYPILENGEEPARKELLADRKFKLWVSVEKDRLKDDKTPYKSENTISSSQFLYAVSVIIHYAIKNKLENDKTFKDFIEKYYSLTMKDHYLRWIFSRGIKKGSFTVKGWKCNSGNFSHREHVENLTDKRYGKEYFKNVGQKIFKDVGYCNAYQDRDGWIAFGLAHLMMANRLNPRMIPIDPEDYKKLELYLKDSLNLFNSRSEYEQFVTPSGRTVDVMVFDKGGLFNHSDLKYSGYYEETFPGWADKAGVEDETKRISEIPEPPEPPKVSWDLSHSRRFVNFYWSFKLITSELKIDFTNQKKYPSLEKSATAYANNLYYKVIKKWDDREGHVEGNVYLTNFICGNNGWYRVNYSKRPGFGYAPSSLSKSAVEGGQAYFIRYNERLYSPLKALFKQYITPTTSKSSDQNVFDELNSIASFPERDGFSSAFPADSKSDELNSF